jgi:hypothetical protein
MPAHDKTPQEPLIRLTAPWAEIRVIPSDALRSIKQILADNGRYRNLDPLLGRSKSRPRTLPTTGRRQGLVAVVKQVTLVRWILQHFAEAGDRPHRLASRASNAILIQTSADPSHRVATGHEVIEDALYYRCFYRIDIQMARAGRTSGDASVSIRHQAIVSGGAI